MSVRQAQVGCTVLSLQDTCVFYPCCKDCLSRIDTEEQDRNRFRCSRCGYRCVRDQVDYRYRLSLKVIRDTSIFGVTVFGNSLNQYFGIHASELQRLVENPDQPTEQPLRSKLLVKAVEDCFIGRHFIFSIKLSVSNGRHAEFVASQMILPTARGLTGCTIVSYYQRLLQKASEYEAGSADPALLSEILLHIPGHSPSSSFSTSTLCGWSPLSQPLLRSPEHQDCSLTPTPPWDQSLGLMTSSAEKEESCSSQDREHKSSRQTDDISATPRPAQRGGKDNHKVIEEGTFGHCSNSSTEKRIGNGLNVNTWFSPSKPDRRRHSHKHKEFSSEQRTRTFLASSLTSEDFPLSESLAEVLCEEKTDFDDVGETKPNLNQQSQKQTSGTFLEVTNLVVESTSACQSNLQKNSSHSSMLLDVTNAPAPDGEGGHDLFKQVGNSHFKSVRKSEAKNIYSCGLSQEDDRVDLSFENKEEQLEGDIYDFSADLFSDSPVNSNTEMLNTPTEKQRTMAEACSPFSKTNRQHLRNEHADATYLTPYKPNRKRKLWNNRNSLILQEAPDLDFVPPAQSTPIVKVCVVTQSLAPSHRNLTGESIQENSTWSLKPSGCGNRATPNRRLRKNHLHRLAPTRIMHRKCDSRVSDVSVDHEDDEAVIALTPLAVRGKRQTDISRSALGSTWKGCQGDGGDCKRPLQNQTVTLSHSLVKTRNTGSKAVTEASLGRSNDSHLDDENQTCDWSRDLFSDSAWE